MSETSSTASAIVSRRLRGVMAEIGVTQTQLGQQIGMPQVLVSKRMRGVVPWKVDEVVDIAQALDVPLERILPLDELAGRRAS